MARIARIVVPDCPHLVRQCGNRGGEVFFSQADRERYLEILTGYLAAAAIRLWAYRLDDSEVRLIVVPPDGRALGDALRNAHTRYSSLINRRQNTTGHLFQGRYYSCPLDGDYLAVAVRYVERFVGDVPPPSRNSAGYRCDGVAGPLADDLPLLQGVSDWHGWLSQPDQPGALGRLLSRLRVGRPAGDADFTRRVEALTGRTLSRSPGRPRGRKA